MQNPSRKLCIVIIVFLSLVAILSKIDVNAQILPDNRLNLQEIRESGLRVVVSDKVKDGCWQDPRSSENKAISNLGQHDLYNANSDLAIFVLALGHIFNNGHCAVRWDVSIVRVIPNAGYFVYGQRGDIFTGPEMSDALKSEVESFIEELVAKLAKEGI